MSCIFCRYDCKDGKFFLSSSVQYYKIKHKYVTKDIDMLNLFYMKDKLMEMNKFGSFNYKVNKKVKLTQKNCYDKFLIHTLIHIFQKVYFLQGPSNIKRKYYFM